MNKQELKARYQAQWETIRVMDQWKSRELLCLVFGELERNNDEAFIIAVEEIIGSIRR